MRTIEREQVELIDALVAEATAGRLNAAVLEKDIHVTDALAALFSISHEHVSFVFCGGTCLSKAYGLIERMSEDIDLKVVLAEGHGLNPSKLRMHLSDLKGLTVGALSAIGFVEDEGARVARNGNRYFASRWTYNPRYQTNVSLRPFLSLELTVRTPRHGSQLRDIGYLSARLAGQLQSCSAVACITTEETLAEKVLSFLRRYAQHRAGAMMQEWDSALVRHVYDVFCIHQQVPDARSQAQKVFRAIVEDDVREFGKQYAPFANNAAAVLREAIAQAAQDPKIEAEYVRYLLPLIFGEVRPSFAEAYAVFRRTAEALVAELDTSPRTRCPAR